MPAAAFIGGDWGTSRLRVGLFDAAGHTLDERFGPGASAARGQFGEIAADLVSPWISQHGRLQMVLSGMVGSNFGWKPAPYLSCPARTEDLARSAVRFATAEGQQVAIAPGLRCINRAGAPDVMRGEETQILGAMLLAKRLREGTHILCLPGTHSKWVLLKGGEIIDFQTAISGELYDILRRHSVLLTAEAEPLNATQPAFERALHQVNANPNANMAQLLFEVRSRALVGDLSPEAAANYLSGLLIGFDVAGAKALYREELERSREVILIGGSDLASSYAKAIELHKLNVVIFDGMSCSFAGLNSLHAALERTGVSHGN